MSGWGTFKAVRYLQVRHPARRYVHKKAYGKARSILRKP